MRSRILHILREPELAEELIQALDAQLPHDHAEQDREPSRHGFFTAMVSRVAQHVANHPRKELIFQLLKDWTLLRRADLYNFLDFFHSCLVSHFKGELAELLAWPLLQNFADYLVTSRLAPPGLRIIPGWAIRARRHPEHLGWYKGADALFVLSGVDPDPCRELPSIGLIAAAEIKSSRTSLRKIFEQLDRHVERLHLGLCLSDTKISSGASTVLISDKPVCKNWLPLTAYAPKGDIYRLAIQPVTISGVPCHLKAYRTRAWISELPFPSLDIIEAAYRFAAWYVCSAGSEVYCDSRTTIPGRIPNPHPEVTFEEAAQNILRESLYHFGHQEDLLREPCPKLRRWSKEELRQRSTFTWLYNSLCYGHMRARGEAVQAPEDHKDLSHTPPDLGPVPETPAAGNDSTPATIEKLIDKCRAFYRQGNQVAAQQALSEVKEIGEFPSLNRKVAWLESMIAYRDARFAEAFATFLGPDHGPRDHWWVRDQIMWARLHSRTRQTAQAKTLLDTLLPLHAWPYRAVPVEYYGVTSLTHLINGDLTQANNDVDSGLAYLEALRAEFADRRARGQSEPDTVHSQTVHMGVYDLVATLSALGRLDEAVHTLISIQGLDGWELNYFSRDPMLVPLLGDPGRQSVLSEWALHASGNQ